MIICKPLFIAMERRLKKAKMYDKLEMRKVQNLAKIIKKSQKINVQNRLKR